MKHVVYSVYDRAAQFYGRPFFVVAAGQATRSFRDEVNRSDSEFGKHPDDYDLWQLGLFDDVSGFFEPAVQLVVRGKDVVEVRQ